MKISILSLWISFNFHLYFTCICLSDVMKKYNLWTNSLCISKQNSWSLLKLAQTCQNWRSPWMFFTSFWKSLSADIIPRSYTKMIFRSKFSRIDTILKINWHCYYSSTCMYYSCNLLLFSNIHYLIFSLKVLLMIVSTLYFTMLHHIPLV